MNVSLQRITLLALLMPLVPVARAGNLPSIDEVLARVREAAGPADAIDRVRSLHSRANCDGPTGSYITEVTSTRDGRVWFRQLRDGETSVEVAVLGMRGWLIDGGEAAESVDARAVATVLGHEFHAAQLWLSERLHDLAIAGRGTLQGREAFVLVGLDPFDNPVRAFVDTGVFRLLGLEWTNPGRPEEPALILYESWSPVADVWLAERVTVLQGGLRFRFDFEDVRVNEVPAERWRTLERAATDAESPAAPR